MIVGAQAPRVESAPVIVNEDAFGKALVMLRAYGFNLDQWQERVLRYSLGKDADGYWSASRVCISVPRQSGKTLLAVARAFYALYDLPARSLIIHSAHLYSTATESFRVLTSVFEDYPQLRDPVVKNGREIVPGVRYIHDWSGDQSIEMTNGTRIKYSARNRGQGRGFSCDLLFLDEVQEFPADAWADIQPTVSARPNAQIWMMGTPPSPKMSGEVFASIRDLGLSGDDPRLYYGEFSATRDMDPSDPVTWAVALPALGTRIREDTVRDEYLSMRDQMMDRFWRERLGVWDEGVHAATFDMRKWDRMGVDDPGEPSGDVAYGADMNADRSRVTVSVAAHVGDRIHVETIRSEPVSLGFDWLIDFFVERRGRGNVVIDGMSPLASMIPEFKANRIKLTVTGASDMRKACGAFYDAYQLDGMSHYSKDLMLSQAIMGAKKKLSGDGGAFVWNRKNFEVDISSLVSATLALWGLTSVKRRSGKATFI